jgi:hypothetical protein
LLQQGVFIFALIYVNFKRFFCFLLACLYAQEDTKDMQAILEGLDKLEQLKVENDTISSSEFLKMAEHNPENLQKQIEESEESSALY